MNGWSEGELAAIGRAEEIQLAADRADRTRGPAVPVWIVRVDDDLYVRSFRGPTGAWYRRAQRHRSGHIRVDAIERTVRFTNADPGARAQIDQAYRAKYGRYGASYIQPMTSDSVAETTLRLEPA